MARVMAIQCYCNWNVDGEWIFQRIVWWRTYLNVKYYRGIIVVVPLVPPTGMWSELCVRTLITFANYIRLYDINIFTRIRILFLLYTETGLKFGPVGELTKIITFARCTGNDQFDLSQRVRNELRRPLERNEHKIIRPEFGKNFGSKTKNVRKNEIKTV